MTRTWRARRGLRSDAEGQESHAASLSHTIARGCPGACALSVETILRLTLAVLGSTVLSIAGLCAAHAWLDDQPLLAAREAIGSSSALGALPGGGPGRGRRRLRTAHALDGRRCSQPAG